MADDRQLCEKGVADLSLQAGVAAEDVPEHRGGDEHERKQREERVVRDDGREIAAAVVGVLALDGDGEGQRGMPLLKAIEAIDELGSSHDERRSSRDETMITPRCSTWRRFRHRVTI